MGETGVGETGVGETGTLDCSTWTHTETLEIPDDGVPLGVAVQVERVATDAVGASGIASVCAVLEHSWARDLEIALRCPTGEFAVLVPYLGESGGEVFLGEPVDSDTVFTPGIGYTYCWSDDASLPTWSEAIAGASEITLAAGTYRADTALAELAPCAANGRWELSVEDNWASDNGFVFSWTLNFAGMMCEGP